MTTERGDRVELETNPGPSLMEFLREFEDGVAAQCGGDLRCGTCHVYVQPGSYGKFPIPSSEECELLRTLNSAMMNSRLSCQLKLQPEHDGVEIAIAPYED